VIVNGVAESSERLLQVFFQKKSGVIRADRHAHARKLYYVEVRNTSHRRATRLAS
jgi:hypothetical protein